MIALNERDDAVQRGVVGIAEEARVQRSRIQKCLDVDECAETNQKKAVPRGKAQLRLTMRALKIQDIAEVIRSNASSSQKQVVELQEQTHVSMSKATKDHLVCCR